MGFILNFLFGLYQESYWRQPFYRINDLAFDWQWSAAVYTYWPGNNTANILPYHQSLHAGTPQNIQVEQWLIQGPRGGGGSYYTGSWSATGNGKCPGAN